MPWSHRPMFSSLFRLRLRLRPNSFPHFSSSSSSSSPTDALDSLLSLCRVGISRTTTAGSDYELALVSALKYCSSLSAVSQGRQVHSLVAKSGLGSNTFILNSLISMYAKCGLVSDARSVFDSCPRLDVVSCNIMVAGYVKNGQLENAHQLFEIMPERSCVAYTSLIMGFAQNYRWRDAVDLFKEMRSENVVPNDLTMASVISACGHVGGVWDCRMLHGLVTKLLVLGSVFVSTNLLNMYCGCSCVEDARKLFDEMPVKNIVSWNVMLNGYSKAGLASLAGDFFRSIPGKDIVSWGTVVDAYFRVGMLSEALTMCREMLTAGLRMNIVMIVDLVSACGRCAAFEEGRQFHGVIVKEGFDRHNFVQATIISFYAACGRFNLARLQFEVGFKDHVTSWNSLIAGYIKNRMLDHARQLFEEMPERDVFSWSIMISGYTQNERPDVALELFHEMIASGIEATEVTMVSVLSSIASLGSMAEGKWVHEYIRSNSIPLNDNLIAAIVDMYAKCGSVNTALEMFRGLRDRVATVSPWNAVICGLAMHGHEKLALEIFSDLETRRRPVRPNSITFIGVLSACCHAGLVELGEEYFDRMKSVYGVDPDIRHYGCMVDLLGRAGRLDEAEELIKGMPMDADVVIWGTLLAACKTHGNVELGERAAEKLASLEPSHGAGRVMLSNIYADAGRWDEAFSVRRDMMAHRMNRSPGCSGVT